MSTDAFLCGRGLYSLCKQVIRALSYELISGRTVREADSKGRNTVRGRRKEGKVRGLLMHLPQGWPHWVCEVRPCSHKRWQNDGEHGKILRVLIQ